MPVPGNSEVKIPEQRKRREGRIHDCAENDKEVAHVFEVQTSAHRDGRRCRPVSDGHAFFLSGNRDAGCAERSAAAGHRVADITFADGGSGLPSGFAELLGQVLKAAPANSDALNDMPLNILFRPVLKENTGADYTYAKMHLTEPGKPTASDITISGETNRNDDTGDASFIAYQQTGTGEPQEAGIWFTNNTLLLKKGHDVRPSLQHTLTPQIAESDAGHWPAYSRLLRVLDDTNAEKMTPEKWDSAVGELQKVVANSCRVQDITTQNGSDSFRRQSHRDNLRNNEAHRPAGCHRGPRTAGTSW